jgi:small conductance mechanosensitive channel
MEAFIRNLWENDRASILAIARSVIMALIIAIAGGIIIKVANKVVRFASGKQRFGVAMDATLLSMLKHVINYLVIIVCVIMILDLFGINTTSLIAVLGAAGVAVGLALKDTLSNIASGIILLFLRPYRKGDFIEFSSFMGTVKDISLFTTTLETPDGIFIAAPNSSIWGTPLKNYSRNGQRRMDLVISIAYSDSIDTAFAVMRQLAAEEQRFLQTPAPQVMVQALTDSSVNILLRAWATTDVYWGIYWDQMRNMKDKAEAAGLHIPFPQRDVHIDIMREEDRAALIPPPVRQLESHP